MLKKETKIKIFSAYYGSPCKYMDANGEWRNGYVGMETLNKLQKEGMAYIELKDLDSLTPKNIAFLSKLTGDEIATENVTSGHIEWFTKLIKSQIADNTLNYQIADYLRRESFMLPLYGLDLVRARLAKLKTN
jgi:hypothetical protein